MMHLGFRCLLIWKSSRGFVISLEKIIEHFGSLKGAVKSETEARVPFISNGQLQSQVPVQCEPRGRLLSIETVG